MNIIPQLRALAIQLLDSSSESLNDQDLVIKIMNLHPDWLPMPIYNPCEKYKRGQRVFHASPEIEDWFLIHLADQKYLEVITDHGQRMTLVHNQQYIAQFPTTLEQYLSLKIKQCHLDEYRKDKKFEEICQKYKIACLYHITHLKNLGMIMAKGLLSHNQVENHVDISDPEIQAGRHNKRIECTPELSVHDYVPLFFAPKPPMLSARREIQAQIIYLQISPKVLCLRGTIFTDGNARSNKTEFFTDLQDLEKLDWEILRARYWSSKDELIRKENVRRRSAEVLVPYHLPASFIQSITVINKKVYDDVINVLKSMNQNIPVMINPDYYFLVCDLTEKTSMRSHQTHIPTPPEFPEDWELLEPPVEDLIWR